METHVKVVGWLWIVSGLAGVFMLATGVIVLNWPGVVPNQQDSLIATVGALCLFIPGLIADFVAGAWVLQYRNWARILAIILAIFNLAFLCYLILPAALGIYTLYVMFNEETKALFGVGSTSTAV